MQGGEKVSSNYEKAEKIYFLIGKAYEQTGAGYLLISFSYEQTSYEQTATAFEEMEKIDFLVPQNKKPLPVFREGPFASYLL